MRLQKHPTAPHPEPSGEADSSIDEAVLRVLSRQPDIVIPEDFASRVSRHVLRHPLPPRNRWAGWGPKLAIASAGLLTAAMFALAPHAAPSLTNLAFDGELVLLAELSGLLLFSRHLLVRD